MPNWKKVIVSGSAGNLSSLSVDTFVSASSINVKGTITADSGSFTYLTTVYETSSIIFSSGSNVLGDESSDLQTLWGRVNLPSGPLTVTGSINASGGFTGSLLGTSSTASFVATAQTASYVFQAISSSYASTSSYFNGLVESASYATTASFAFSIPDQGFQFTQAIGTSSWTVNHNLNTFTPLVDVYDSSYNQLIPAGVSSISSNTTQITFSTAQAGFAIISKGSGVSSTNAITASYALTASYAASVGPLSQSVQITGSLTISGSSTFRNIGPAEFTGSVSVSGSINYTGNQTVSNGYVILSQVSQSLNFADDNAAATGGVPLGGLYRNGNFILIRVGGSAFTLFSGTVKFSDYTGPNCSSATEVTVSGNNDTFCTSTIFTSDSFLELTNDTYYLAFGGNYVQITITGADIAPQNTATVTSVCGTCP